MNNAIVTSDFRVPRVSEPSTAGTLTFVALLTLAIGVLTTVSIVALSGSAEAQTACGTLQVRVDAAPAGATVDLPDGCVYREAVEIDKPITLIGGPGVEIRGSDVWTSWTRNSSGYWVSERSVPGFEAITKITDPQHPYPCKDSTSRCKWPEQVFIDGRPLLQVASDPQGGQFAVTDTRRVILADDPTGIAVEVTERRQWVFGRSGGVTIEDLAMKHAANGLNTVAIENNGHPNWTLKNNDLSYAHSMILALGGATGLRLEGNDVHHGGLLGISSSGNADLEAINNEIHDNNTEAFYPAWKSAGMKVANASRFVASGNEVYGNDQTGIWIDNGSENVTISNNRVHHNVKRGIHIEISDHAKVFGNAIYENGWGTFVDDASGAEGVGISATASRDVQIHDNTLAWNASGISVVNSKRTHGTGGTDPIFSTVSDVLVHDNTVLKEEQAGLTVNALVWRKTYAEGNIYEPVANNRGYDNSYWSSSPEGSSQYRFFWDDRYARLADFNATPGEERSRYLTSAEKDQVVTTEGVPAAPEREIDVTPPDAPQITNPAQDRYTNVHGFSVSGTAEPGSTIELFEGESSEKSGITTDSSGNWGTSFGFVKNGEYAYTAKSTDGVNNTSAVSDVRRVIVDSQKPNTMIDSGPASVDKTASATLSFSSDETGTNFECALDGAAFGPCTSPKSYAGLGEGQHDFSVRAVDRAGNTDATPAKRAWAVDTNGAPAVTSVVPAEDATGVSLAAKLAVFFSEPMMSSTINAKTVKLYKVGSSTARSATVTYDATARKATLNPGADLQPGAEYKAVVSTGAKDIAGIQLDQDPNLAGNQSKVWYFTARN